MKIAAVNICSHLKEKHMKLNIKETCVCTMGSAYIIGNTQLFGIIRQNFYILDVRNSYVHRCLAQGGRRQYTSVFMEKHNCKTLE